MSDINREIQDLLIDYAGALRDGCIPTFLQSITREEGQAMASSEQFWDATEMVRILNGNAFADKALMPDVSLFMSRVNANIVSRMKKARGASQNRQNQKDSLRKTNTKLTDKSQTIE